MPISVVVGGDVVINGPLHRPIAANPVYRELHTADANFVNLEMPFASPTAAANTDTYGAEKLIALHADPSHAPVLRDLGLDVVTVANNHGMDFGVGGLRTTLQALDGVGIAHVGGGETQAEAFGVVVQKGIAFLGVTTTLPNGSGAGRARPGLAGVRVFTKYVVDTVSLDESPGMAPFVETQTYAADEAVLLDAIRQAAARTDVSVVVVGIHWGVPYGWVAATQDEIAQYQRPLARAMVDAGASVVVGHHPHVVQGVELYRGAPIFYSLGNFIFSNDIVTPDETFRTYPPYEWGSLQKTLSNIGSLARLEWDEGKLTGCVMIPVTVEADGEPTYATAADAEVLVARVRSMSQAYGAAVELVQTSDGHYAIRVTEAK
ncbi:poly-gamma-glutamate synthesis protein (capsule biosynthesis protein) [Sporothrix schenckii 1099-18]|uniref:Poly-gamma-glutamate synthesis protein (Capsule biosynthesis protein) n=1 Tax=Sporothrix schenckii 1099-18 TaxID=1397361 RepID=A0A0F2MM35_SPOSC|nr:poly-gamma-glutamate synthesis protein (capsule biosynthesis protein) [Sporothrix schenckii 1099-18]KJR89241.1 poly-gamma-glutamate synthesis protein (capsule biosynthesis protein) [Sporothrix schenckii 1099-18]